MVGSMGGGGAKGATGVGKSEWGEGQTTAGEVLAFYQRAGGRQYKARATGGMQNWKLGQKRARSSNGLG